MADIRKSVLDRAMASLPDAEAPTNHPSCRRLSNETQLYGIAVQMRLGGWAAGVSKAVRGEAGGRREVFLLLQFLLKS